MTTRVRIGDIVEITTKRGLAYAQYTHRHRSLVAVRGLGKREALKRLELLEG